MLPDSSPYTILFACTDKVADQRTAGSGKSHCNHKRNPRYIADYIGNSQRPFSKMFHKKEEDVYRSALTLRPEIEAGRLNVKASELDINIARSGYIPTISLSAGIGSTNTNGNDFTFGEQIKQNWNNSLGVTVSVPIFNNRQTKSAVQKAKIQKQNSELDLLDNQKNLYKTIEGLWLDANSAQQRYVAAIEKLRSTQTSYDLIQEQFNLGMKNTVELLTEKNNLLNAQQETLQAKYMAILNTQLLKFYQGEQITL